MILIFDGAGIREQIPHKIKARGGADSADNTDKRSDCFHFYTIVILYARELDQNLFDRQERGLNA